MSWETSDRRDRLPRWWPVTVRRILKRDPICRCTGCSKCFKGLRGFTPPTAGCTRASTEVDHTERGDDHRDINLRGMCKPCHGLKSSQEGNAARAEQRALSKRPKPPERHPGEIRRRP